jgi:hypothetical protein
MPIESFISADSHVVEPADLWITRMEPRFRERAPRFERGPQGDHWVVEGLNSLPIGLFGAMVSEKAQGGIGVAARSAGMKRLVRERIIPKPGSSIRISITSKPRLSIRVSA